ncbi:lytic transglycosylase domain-containing protein [Fusibacter sp. 3D3]|uniref:lytic transglycosylase domain-containing protein n=1 Tax=Fusibacter sp. 3D3 TaxID=1048380 RepID=UPI000853C9D1|nr:transglycosylase SLT domain-containing protein [Fusibacter sp. 3D3]GAU76362.1 soluble lytic murein transglycosylase precursor [Fusibacter sp. 3D3]
MEARQKIFYGAFITLLFIVIMLAFQQIKAAQKIETYENEHALLTSQITEQENKIESLTASLESAKMTLSNQSGMVDEFKRLSKFIDFTEFDSSQLERSQKIVDETPLDSESALALVKYSDQYDVPVSLILSIMEIESNFDEDLVGADQDRGLMQIIPGTEKWLATEYGNELGLTYDPDRIFDADYNIALGVKYLDILMNSHGSNFERILSEYNRGPNNLKKYYALNQTYSTTYSRSVLSREKKYVALNN